MSLGPPEKVITVNLISAVATVSSKVNDTLFSSTTTEKLTRFGGSTSSIISIALAAKLISPSISSFTLLSLASRRNESGYRIQQSPTVVQVTLSLFSMFKSSLTICRITSVLYSSAALRISPDCKGSAFPTSSKLDCSLTSVKFTYCKSITSSYSRTMMPSETLKDLN